MKREQLAININLYSIFFLSSIESASFSLLNAQGIKIKTVSRQLETQQNEPGYDALVTALCTGFDRICHEAVSELKN